MAYVRKTKDTKRGHPRNIKNPEQLWDLFEDYKLATKSNPIMKMVHVGKNGTPTYEERERALTLDGFEVYCYKIVGTVHQYFDNQDNLYGDYMVICRAIKKEIREDQIQGGLAGIYNPSITQRLNNLVEKTENVNTNVEVPLFPDTENK